MTIISSADWSNKVGLAFTKATPRSCEGESTLQGRLFNSRRAKFSLVLCTYLRKGDQREDEGRRRCCVLSIEVPTLMERDVIAPSVQVSIAEESFAL
ncbi:hypothetical protein J6590_018955 [Homalodisca vitripennis]|nr:hypothetical protein J6590_018955 [Homalodisca vitripennis]